MPPEYNKMHEKLVKNDRDLVGMIAYSIYKVEKRKAICSGLDINGFTKLKTQPHEIASYKQKAEALANLFLQTAADDEIKKIKNELAAKINNIAMEDLPKDSTWKRFTKWHHSGASGVIGNFWTAVIVATFVYFFSDAGMWEKAKETAVSKFMMSTPSVPPDGEDG
ncbi:hypothetical protein D6R50_22255 [Aeromonas veronii]|uniref:Uncharacterized protein n=1 Tax=Aeromonas veronii TaxID=654 RepID=A0A3A9INS7_AERVE|nr:hypothetical protein [Aeromonas veronii]RKJ84387.1 hypothetical protein D6R50_22255 [Aeromonas veronii]